MTDGLIFWVIVAIVTLVVLYQWSGIKIRVEVRRVKEESPREVIVDREEVHARRGREREELYHEIGGEGGSGS